MFYIALTWWSETKRKNSPSFPALSRAINLLFLYIIAKSNHNNDCLLGNNQLRIVQISILADIY